MTFQHHFGPATETEESVPLVLKCPNAEARSASTMSPSLCPFPALHIPEHVTSKSINFPTSSVSPNFRHCQIQAAPFFRLLSCFPSYIRDCGGTPEPDSITCHSCPFVSGRYFPVVLQHTRCEVYALAYVHTVISPSTVRRGVSASCHQNRHQDLFFLDRVIRYS